MEKVIRDGKVAVLVSSGFGAGWYTWNTSYPQLMFHPEIVHMVEQGKQMDIDEDWIKEKLGIDIYAGGSDGLKIHWLPVGSRFYIDEYDGAETLMDSEDLIHTA